MLLNFNIIFGINFTGTFPGQLSTKIAQTVPLHTRTKNRNTFKQLLNGWMDFEIISQECSLCDSTKIAETVPLHRTRWPQELKIEKLLNNF